MGPGRGRLRDRIEEVRLRGQGRLSTGPAVHIGPVREASKYVVSSRGMNKSHFGVGLLVTCPEIL